MIKRLFTIYLLLVTSVFSQQIFTSKDYSFEITFPDYMNVVKDAGSRTAVFAYMDSYTSLNIVAARDTSALKIADYDDAAFAEQLKTSLSADMPGFEFLGSGRKDINSNASIFIDYNYYKGNEKMRAVQYFLKHNSWMYAITTVTPEAEFNVNEIVFNSILITFKFKE